MRYRLLAVDIDQTLLGHDGKISPETRRAVDLARDAGILVVLATGRAWALTKPWVDELGLDGPAVCSAGAITIRGSDGSVISSRPLARDLSDEILGFGRDRGYCISATYLDGVLYNLEPEPLPGEGGENLTEFFFGHPVEKHCLLGPEGLKEPPLYLTALGHRAVDDLIRAFGERLGVICCPYSYPPDGKVLYMLNHRATKGAALEDLAFELGVKRSEVAAVGDSENDISMLRWAGLGVATGWAPDHVKKAGNLVLDREDPHPVARVVEGLLALKG